MDHKPYEDWLLNDERLTIEQNRDLRVHLRNCPECATLARANLTLRSAPVVAPSAGFTARFQARLADQRQQQRKRSFFGLFFLAIIGVGGILWLLIPYLPFLALSPERIASLWISNLIYIGLTLRALSVVGNTFVEVLGSYIPGYAWPMALILLSGLVMIWTFAFRRIGQTIYAAI